MAGAVRVPNTRWYILGGGGAAGGRAPPPPGGGAPRGPPLQDPRAELFVPQAGVDRQVLQIEAPGGAPAEDDGGDALPAQDDLRQEERIGERLHEVFPAAFLAPGERGVVNAPRLGETGVLRALQPPPSEGRCMFFHD